MLSVRGARRYRWRLAGGRLVVDGAAVRFVPNRLERRRPDTYWECRARDVTGVGTHGKVWLVIRTAGGATETFRFFGAAAVAARLEAALAGPATTTTATP